MRRIVYARIFDSQNSWFYIYKGHKTIQSAIRTAKDQVVFVVIHWNTLKKEAIDDNLLKLKRSGFFNCFIGASSVCTEPIPVD